MSAKRQPADPANPFLALEKIWADGVVQAFDFWRDVRDAASELSFFALYGSPAMQRIGASHAYQRKQIDPKELAHLPEVEAIMLGVDRGGFEEGVIRMLIVLAGARGAVRRDRLERSAHMLSKDEPFASLGAEKRAALIREQTIIVEFAGDRAISTLPDLLKSGADRRRAIELVEYIAGSIEEMEPHTIRALQMMRAALGLPPMIASVETQDPLTAVSERRKSA